MTPRAIPKGGEGTELIAKGGLTTVRRLRRSGVEGHAFITFGLSSKGKRNDKAAMQESCREGGGFVCSHEGLGYVRAWVVMNEYQLAVLSNREENHLGESMFKAFSFFFSTKEKSVTDGIGILAP